MVLGQGGRSSSNFVKIFEDTYLRIVPIAPPPTNYHTTTTIHLLHIIVPVDEIMNTASIFRSIARKRRSSRRFQANKCIPAAMLQDILETTLVSAAMESEVARLSKISLLSRTSRIYIYMHTYIFPHRDHLPVSIYNPVKLSWSKTSR